MKIKLKPYLLNYMGLLLLIPQISLAKEYLDETMVVTANAGLSVDINKAAATMSVIDVQEQRKYQMAIDAGDLVADTPGVNVSTQSNGSRSVRIRGLGNEYTQVLLNGHRSYTKEALWRGSDNALSLTPSVAIDNLEVIRGPMSTLYGADTMGGVINVITRKHNGVAEGAMSVEGQYNQGDNGGNGQVYGLYFSTPVSDSISYTVYGNYLDVNESLYSWQPGFTKHRAQENYNLVNNFDLSIHDQHDLGLEIQLSREDQFGASMFRGRAFEQERQLQKYMLNYEYSSYFMLLDANFYYSNFDVTYDVSTSDITEQNFGGDLQASFFVGDHSITVGAEARQADINNIGITRGSTGRATTAAYMETNLELSEPTTLTLGGRFDQDSLFGSEFTYRGYITQGLNDLLNLKAGVGTAFKAPSIAQVLQTYTAPASGPACPVSPAICNVYGNPELKAETGTFSELGVYYANGLTFANATLFSNRVEDIIHKVERTNSSGGYYTFSNVDKAELRGLELNVEHQYEQVNMDVSYTYLDAIDTHREATGGYISS